MRGIAYTVKEDYDRAIAGYTEKKEIAAGVAVRVPPTVAEPLMDAAPVRAASPPEPRQEAP